MATHATERGNSDGEVDAIYCMLTVPRLDQLASLGSFPFIITFISPGVFSFCRIMKSFLIASAVCGILASAAPVGSIVDDTANGMQDVIDGAAACASTAVIFARGTFDSG